VQAYRGFESLPLRQRSDSWLIWLNRLADEDFDISARDFSAEPRMACPNAVAAAAAVEADSWLGLAAPPVVENRRRTLVVNRFIPVRYEKIFTR
jgi:hypothetical protein